MLFSEKNKMKTKKTNDEIAIEIYRRMYAQATPKADIDEIIKSGEGKKPNWFLKYYLSREKQEKILDDALKEFKVPKRNHSRFYTEIMLGAAPSGYKKDKKIK